jgi:hypothetical protein
MREASLQAMRESLASGNIILAVKRTDPEFHFRTGYTIIPFESLIKEQEGLSEFTILFRLATSVSQIVRLNKHQFSQMLSSAYYHHHILPLSTVKNSRLTLEELGLGYENIRLNAFSHKSLISNRRRIAYGGDFPEPYAVMLCHYLRDFLNTRIVSQESVLNHANWIIWNDIPTSPLGNYVELNREMIDSEEERIQRQRRILRFCEIVHLSIDSMKLKLSQNLWEAYHHTTQNGLLPFETIDGDLSHGTLNDEEFTFRTLDEFNSMFNYIDQPRYDSSGYILTDKIYHVGDRPKIDIILAPTASGKTFLVSTVSAAYKIVDGDTLIKWPDELHFWRSWSTERLKAFNRENFNFLLDYARTHNVIVLIGIPFNWLEGLDTSTTVYMYVPVETRIKNIRKRDNPYAPDESDIRREQDWQPHHISKYLKVRSFSWIRSFIQGHIVNSLPPGVLYKEIGGSDSYYTEWCGLNTFLDLVELRARYVSHILIIKADLDNPGVITFHDAFRHENLYVVTDRTESMLGSKLYPEFPLIGNAYNGFIYSGSDSMGLHNFNRVPSGSLVLLNGSNDDPEVRDWAINLYAQARSDGKFNGKSIGNWERISVHDKDAIQYYDHPDFVKNGNFAAFIDTSRMRRDYENSVINKRVSVSLENEESAPMLYPYVHEGDIIIDSRLWNDAALRRSSNPLTDMILLRRDSLSVGDIILYYRDDYHVIPLREIPRYIFDDYKDKEYFMNVRYDPNHYMLAIKDEVLYSKIKHLPDYNDFVKRAANLARAHHNVSSDDLQRLRLDIQASRWEVRGRTEMAWIKGETELLTKISGHMQWFVIGLATKEVDFKTYLINSRDNMIYRRGRFSDDFFQWHGLHEFIHGALAGCAFLDHPNRRLVMGYIASTYADVLDLVKVPLYYSGSPSIEYKLKDWYPKGMADVNCEINESISKMSRI